MSTIDNTVKKLEEILECPQNNSNERNYYELLLKKYPYAYPFALKAYEHLPPEEADKLLSQYYESYRDNGIFWEHIMEFFQNKSEKLYKKAILNSFFSFFNNGKENIKRLRKIDFCLFLFLYIVYAVISAKFLFKNFSSKSKFLKIIKIIYVTLKIFYKFIISTMYSIFFLFKEYFKIIRSLTNTEKIDIDNKFQDKLNLIKSFFNGKLNLIKSFFNGKLKLYPEINMDHLFKINTFPSYSKQNSVFMQFIIWGEDYISDFTEISIPTMLNGKNLEFFHLMDVHIIIYCKKNDTMTFEKSVNFIRLKNYAKIYYVYIDILYIDLSMKINILTYSNRHFLKHISHLDGHIMFLTPDEIYASNFFYSMIEYINSNIDILYYFVPFRINKKIFKKDFLTHKIDMSKFDSKNFYSLIKKYLHNNTLENFIDSHLMPKIPSVFLYGKDTDSFVGKAIHLHPICIKIYKENKDIFFLQSIDGDFLIRTSNKISKIKIVEDMEIALCANLTPECDMNSTEIVSMFEYYKSTYKHLKSSADVIHRAFFDKFIFTYFSDTINTTGKEDMINSISSFSQHIFSNFEIHH